MEIFSVKHSGPSGDIIYSLPAVKEYARQYGPVTYYLQLDKKAFYYEGAQHPDGENALPKARAEILIPLLESLPFIERATIWEGERVILDLDSIHAYKNGKPFGSISRWYFHVWSELTADLSERVIPIDHNPQDYILVNRTSRYRNEEISYHFLQHRPEPIYFIGLLEELAVFRLQVPKANYLPTKNCLDIANAIAGSKIFIGNQSMAFAIAEMMKVPRLLEAAYGQFNNVIPTGKDAYDAFTQHNFQSIVEMICKR